MFQKILLFCIGLFLCLSVLPTSALAQSTDLYVKGTISAIIQEEELRENEMTGFIQTLEVTRADNGEKVQVVAGSRFQPLDEARRIPVGRQVVMSHQETTEDTREWVLVDATYRLPILAGLAVFFFLIVIVVARLQGFLSITGMGVSFGILSLFIIPQILSGANPFVISIAASILIGAVSMYVTHGISLKSHIAFGAIIATLSTVAILSTVVLSLAHMTGTGSEEAVFLQIDPGNKVNLQGLLLAGIVLGTLGILDDICIAQVSIVRELIKAKPRIGLGELLTSSMAVGKDHIASLVNTLILAYAGASLPLFLLFSQNNTRPWWVVLNDEMIAEEIVRTLSGSIGLVLAVPLTTVVAAVVFLRKK